MLSTVHGFRCGGLKSRPLVSFAYHCPCLARPCLLPVPWPCDNLLNRTLLKLPTHGVKTRVVPILPPSLISPLHHLRTDLALLSSVRQLHPSLIFTFPHLYIFSMPVVRNSKSHDDTFHHLAEAVNEKHTTSQDLGEVNLRYSRRTLTGDRLLPRRRSYILNDTQGVPNSEITHLRGRRSGHRLTLSIYLSGHPTLVQRSVSLDEGYFTQSEDTHIDDIDDGFTHQTQPEGSGSANHLSDTGFYPSEPSIDTIPGSQEQFDQEVMIYYNGIDDSSLASQFLNLDDEAWPCTDQIVTPELDSLASPSSSLSSVSTGDTLEWELEQNSLHLVDMQKFETFVDFDGNMKTTPWPWGDYKYQPPTLPSYFDPQECAIEYQLLEIEKMLREQLTETMAEEAILEGKRAMDRKEKRERRERSERRWKMRAEKDNRPTTLAFDNEVVRGRTIYNP